MSKLCSLVAGCVVVAVCAATSVAQPGPSGPPSKTLERAMALYDKGDYFAASIELDKVASGETADTTANVQRGEFFLAKTLYQMKLYVPALSYFNRIVDAGDSHRFFGATLKWLVAIAAVVPRSMVTDKLVAFDGWVDDPQLGEARDLAAFLVADGMANRGRYLDAAALLETVSADDPVFGGAQLLLGRLYTTLGKRAEAMAAYGRVPADSELATEAALALAREHAYDDDLDGARAVYGRGGAGTGPLAAIARIEAFLIGRAGGLAAVDSDVLRGLVYHDYCTGGDTDDALAATRTAGADVRRVLQQLLAYEDYAELYAAIRQAQKRVDAESERLRVILAIVANGERVRDVLAAMDEMTGELEMFEATDRAWQTTAVANYVLEELTLSQALAEADAGKLLRGHLARALTDIDAILAAPAMTTAELGARADGCPDGVGPAPKDSPVAQPPETTAPLSVVPASKSGCAGCASGGGTRGAGVWLIVAVLVAVRRRRRGAL